ncbi:single-stranded-DNA-specific exonuclease RecJ [bacterium]|nr:single-stranded-DNA-specific exonuclease RecJ [bacterium]
MNMRWQLADEPDPQRLRMFCKELNISPIIAGLLLNRGIETAEQGHEFLHPRLEDLHDPFAFKDMGLAVDRIIKALRNKEPIMIFGDYDVDGITATSVLYLILARLGADVSYYVPNRMSEGYGLSAVGIQEARERGVTLIISVDCGITAIDEVNLARSQGIDVIITDHHEVQDRLPSAQAILNPKRPDDQYPDKYLAGVGVAFKLAQGLYSKLGFDDSELEEHLDLVAMGTAADIVPMVGENRILTKFGLEQVAKTGKIGLRCLVETIGLLGEEIQTGHVVFMLAPRINAVGRLGNAQRAISLLTTTQAEEARQNARFLNDENRRRKDIDGSMLEEAKDLIQKTVDLESDRAIVLASEKWHPGVIGIVASRVVEQCYRPAVLIALDGEQGKGSGRSIAGFNLYEALEACQEHLTRFGGHKYAAGLTIEAKNVAVFREKLKGLAAEKLSPEQLVPSLKIDVSTTLDQVGEDLLDSLNTLAPFGPQNMRPVIMASNLEVVGYPRVVGKNHLKFRVRQNGKVLDVIAFGMGERLGDLEMGKPNLSVAFVLEENRWQGRTSLQLRAKDLRVNAVGTSSLYSSRRI